MRKIDVDFDVHQLIELERRNFGESPNDVLRRLLGLLLRGKTFQHRSGREAMTIILRELAIADPGILECCARHPSNQGCKRRHIARSLAQLYPDRPDLEQQHEAVPGGWFVGTNISNAQKTKVIKIAASCANLKLGTDIAVPSLGVGDL